LLKEITGVFDTAGLDKETSYGSSRMYSLQSKQTNK